MKASDKVGVSLLVLLVPIVVWLYWLLWCWVLPQLWADGPENFIRPGFWLFVGMSFLKVYVFGVRK